MRELGLFGSLVPAEYGGLGCDVTTYARIIEELCRGWMSLAGVINSHTMAALIVLHHGTEEQRRRLPAALRQRSRRAAGSASPSRTPAPTSRRSAPRRVARRRSLSAERQQDVHHQRPRGPRLRAAGDHRQPRAAAPPRHVVLHRREGPPGLPGREVAGQARLQGRRHGGAALRGLPGAGGEPGRRRRGPRLRSGHERAGGRPHQHRRPLRRRGAGRLRGRAGPRARERRRPRRRRWPTSPPGWRRPGSSPTGPPA